MYSPYEASLYHASASMYGGQPAYTTVRSTTSSDVGISLLQVIHYARESTRDSKLTNEGKDRYSDVGGSEIRTLVLRRKRRRVTIIWLPARPVRLGQVLENCPSPGGCAPNLGSFHCTALEPDACKTQGARHGSDRTRMSATEMRLEMAIGQDSLRG
jgi:hypothetical protein